VTSDPRRQTAYLSRPRRSVNAGLTETAPKARRCGEGRVIKWQRRIERVRDSPTASRGARRDERIESRCWGRRIEMQMRSLSAPAGHGVDVARESLPTTPLWVRGQERDVLRLQELGRARVRSMVPKVPPASRRRADAVTWVACALRHAK